MQTQDYDQVIDEERWDHWLSGGMMLFFSALCLCVCEYKLIRGLWFPPVRPHGLVDQVMLPLLVSSPFVFAVLFQRRAMRLFLMGEMKLSLAQSFSNGLSCFCWLTYVIIYAFIKLSF